jgi:hypothetical protein
MRPRCYRSFTKAAPAASLSAWAWRKLTNSRCP